jgi:hypothetical protein
MTPPLIERLVQDGLRFYLDSRGALRWRHTRRLTAEERAAVVENKNEIVAAMFPRIPFAGGARVCEPCRWMHGFRCTHADGMGVERSDGRGCDRYER